MAGCANRPTFDAVEGVPDFQAWSYFEGAPAQVATALRGVLTLDGYTVGTVASGQGGRQYVRVTGTPPGADLAEVVVEPVAMSGSTAGTLLWERVVPEAELRNPE